MRTIPVQTYPVTPTFDSPQLAIAHAKNYAPLVKAKADAASMAAAQILDGFWNDTNFVIRFSNGRYLHVLIDPLTHGAKVNWAILDHEPTIGTGTAERVGSPAVSLEFPASKYLMDCSKILAARRGKELKNFFVNELGFYLYTPKQLCMFFGRVYHRDTKTNLLYIEEVD